MNTAKSGTIHMACALALLVGYFPAVVCKDTIISATLVPDDVEVFGGSVAFNRPRLQILRPENGEVLETSDLDIIVKVLPFQT